MSNRRFHLCGLFAVLLALMAQLGGGASVPRIDPVAAAGVLCHAEDDGGSGAPSRAPSHPVDCPACPLCVTIQAQAVPLLSHSAHLAPPPVAHGRRSELPPPSTAPPAAYRPPSQSRAPPAYS